MASYWMSLFVSLLIVAVCASLRVPNVEAAKLPETNETPCHRDVDCIFKKLPKCTGFFVCNDQGKCDCIPGKTPPPEANLEANADQQCVGDVDCERFLHLPCKGSFVCNHGKCVCITGKTPPPQVEVATDHETPCHRDVDCQFKKLPKCRGFFVCNNHGKCDCIPGKTPSPEVNA